MFIAQNTVRMHDTDMAGILYFARQFRFAHDALEDFMHSEGVKFQDLFKKKEYAFVIVHAEADYIAPVQVGDFLEVHLTVARLGVTSFTLNYQIYRKSDNLLIGTAETVHVTIDPKTRKKIHLPAKLKTLLSKHKVSSQNSAVSKK